MKHLSSLSNNRVLGILFGIGLLTYFRVFFNGYVGDDESLIYNFGLIKNFTDLPKVFSFHYVVLGSEDALLNGYYKPLMPFFLYTIRGIFGLNPFFYHAPQVILSVINSYLVYLFFSTYFKKDLALILSIIFLIHPINQEAVAYISSIQDILFFMFGISAFLLSARPTTSLRNYTMIYFLLLFSLFSKEAGILFLGIVIIYLALLQRKNFLKKGAIVFSAFFTYLIFRLLSNNTHVAWIEPPPMALISLNQRLSHIPLLFQYYLKTFFYPNTLIFNQQWIIHKFSFHTFALPLSISFLFITTLLISALCQFKKRSKKKLIFLFFTIWFFIGIIPHLQIVTLDATVADRWFYFSSVGLLGTIGVGIEYIISKNKKQEKIIFILLIALCIFLSARTYARNIEWADAFTLYSHDAALSKSALIENNLGDEYFKKEDYSNAQIHFKKALEINPNLWVALNNLGIIEEKNGNLKQALLYYKKANKQGEHLPITENIARVYVLDKKYKTAITFIKPEIKKYPLSAKLPLTLSLSYFELGDYINALTWAKKSYSLDPNSQTQQVIDAILQKLQ